MADLGQPIETIARLTPRQRSALAKLGIKTARDLLFHFPSRYEEVGDLKAIGDLHEGEKATVIAEVVRLKAEKTWKKKLRIAEGVVRDPAGSGTGLLGVVWFNQPYIAGLLKPGMRVRLSGKVTRGKNGLAMSNPLFEPVIGAESERIGKDGPLPVYPETYGITSRWFRYQIERALKNSGALPETLPAEILKKYHLPVFDRALRAIHFPKSSGEAEAARKRFAFEEIFLIQLNRQRERKRHEQERAISIETDAGLLKRFTGTLPFSLTNAQRKAIWQILQDFKKPHPMARLLEGDVGSGKTLVAAAVALDAVASGYQVAYMAPTEILARQHFEEFIKRLRPFKIRIGLLTGAEGRKFPAKVNPRSHTHIARSQLLRWCLNGEIQILIGTHALIEERVKFKKLAFAVVDEQHRFGVRQRALLTARGLTQSRTQMNADSDFLYESLTYQIRGAALQVTNELGLGLKESMYQEALAEELANRNIAFTREEYIPVAYSGKRIGSFRPDFIIAGKILVELKSVPLIGKIEERQIWTYLKGSPYRLALLINFGGGELGIRRIVYDTARNNRRKSASHQRESASVRPHFLSMSATPIPRTLALTLYGDLDLTVLDEMPPGREPVETRIIPPREREKTYAFIQDEVQKGGQVFVICPRIEDPKDAHSTSSGQAKSADAAKAVENVELLRPTSQQKLEWSEVKSVKAEFKKLSEEIFPDLRIGMVHGKLLPKEKETVMRKFKHHELDILVSTSVVEVGVDVPNASIMMIEGGERFGLAQLHQFRGRVGRGPRKSYCFVFTTAADHAGSRRLKALQEVKTGFELAEYDLQFRGPGELSGTRQWGISDVGMEALKNIKMVEAARSEAARLIAEDIELMKYPNLKERVGLLGDALHFE